MKSKYFISIIIILILLGAVVVYFYAPSVEGGLKMIDNGKITYPLYLDDKYNIWYSTDEYSEIIELKNDLSLDKPIKRPGIANIGLIDNGNIWAFQLSLLAKSKDNGLTWECFSKDNYRNCDNTIHTYNFNGIRSIVSNNNSLFLGTYQGIYRSIDNGNTWKGVYFEESSDGSKSVYDLFMDNKKIFASTNGRIIESSDNGDTWNISLDNNTTFFFVGSNSDSIYAYGYQQGSLWRKKSGKEWEVASYLPVKKKKGNEQCEFKFSISPTGDIWASCSLFTSGYKGGDFPTIELIEAYLLRSKDGGYTWETINIGNKIMYISDIKFLPSGDMLLATDSGLFKKDIGKVSG